MHNLRNKLITLIKATLWITDGKSIEPKKTIVVYHHRNNAGLRVRYCSDTVYPLDYDKNANQRPGSKFEENFNAWAAEIKEATMPAETVMNNRLREAKQLLTNSKSLNNK